MELETPLEKAFRLNDAQKKAFNSLGLLNVKDLLFHFPTRYNQFVESAPLLSSEVGSTGTWYGKVSNLKLGKSFRKRIAMAEGRFTDTTGSIKLIWFNQPYLAKMLHENALVAVSGKIVTKNEERYIANPEIEIIPELPENIKDSLFGQMGLEKSNDLFYYPIYRESRGITSKFIYYAIQKIFKAGLLEKISDPIPSLILEKYHLPTLKTALIWIHNPKKSDDSLVARKRFAFEEVFLIQLTLQKERLEHQKHQGFIIEAPREKTDNFLKRFPFEATTAQKKAIASILSDFKKGRPMSRLLEGDVGSGKTAVAATSAYFAITTAPRGQNFGTLQVAYMAPTEILATQHFESFIQYFKHLPIQIALITGSGCRKFPSKINPSGSTPISRPQLLKWVQNGEIAVLIGTHALIQKSVKFKNLAYIIIDEQHRFGTKQRQKLSRKSNPVPHLLSMTATPIPRTLALTIYGDLDLTLLDEMPHGRKPIITEIIPPTKRLETYEKIRTELKSGRQAYVICPRINEPDPEKEMAVIAKSVEAEAIRLKREIFPEYSIGILHSKMKPKEKDDLMLNFKNKKIDILVATSVVEVGVNVPNATVIIIEGAERFGLSQLHQLRGRVIRSNDQAYCYIFSESSGAKTTDRLKALVTAKNGFELAERDLQLRGAGELVGFKQWGVTDIGMEAIKNLKMVEAARLEAARLIAEDPELKAYPSLRAIREIRAAALHLE